MLYPCTTVLVGKALTADGSIIHAHNEDMGNKTVGRLWNVQSTIKSQPNSVWAPYVFLPESGQKLGYWASGNTRQVHKDELNEIPLPYDNILVGMNEAGLTMSCNWMYSKEESLVKAGIRRYAIRQLILERCSTAYEAVILIGSLIDKYGQADWGGLTYVLADPNEGWIVETTTHAWVAKKLKDGEIIALANRYTIGEEYDLSSTTLIPLAINNGWYNPADGLFNFKNTYGDSEYMDEMYDIEREQRVHQLLASRKGEINPQDLMIVLKDRYHNTDAYTIPTDFEPDRLTCRAREAKRPICTNLCQSTFVAHLRPDLPKAIGPVFWYTMATPAYGPYFPIYPIGTKIEESFSVDDPKETNSTAWWVYRHLQQDLDRLSQESIAQFRHEAWNKTKTFINEQLEWESKAKTQFTEGNLNQVESILNQATSQSAKSSLKYVKQQLKKISP